MRTEIWLKFDCKWQKKKKKFCSHTTFSLIHFHRCASSVKSGAAIIDCGENDTIVKGKAIICHFCILNIKTL